jgi:hypothetical protein
MKPIIFFCFFTVSCYVFGQECDKIIFKDGREVPSLIEEIGISEIIYRKCDNSSTSPKFVVSKKDVTKIQLRDGSIQIVDYKSKGEKEQHSELKKDSRIIYGFDFYAGMGKQLFKRDEITFTDVNGNVVGRVDWKNKPYYGGSAYLDISIGSKSYLGINAGLEHYPLSLGFLEYSKFYFPLEAEYKFLNSSTKNSIGFSIGMGYSLSTLSLKPASYPESVNNSSSHSVAVSVNNFGLGSGLIISPTMFYSRQIGNYGLSFKLGYRVQGYALNILSTTSVVNSQENISYLYPKGVLQSVRLSVGISRIQYQK